MTRARPLLVALAVATVAVGLSACQPKPRVLVLGDSLAAEAFRAIADRLVTEAVPPAELAGCSARLLEAATAALDAADGEAETSVALEGTDA